MPHRAGVVSRDCASHKVKRAARQTEQPKVLLGESLVEGRATVFGYRVIKNKHKLRMMKTRGTGGPGSCGSLHTRAALLDSDPMQMTHSSLHCSLSLADFD